MSSYAEHHLVYRIANMDVRRFPFPHFYVEDVFPAEFFARMRKFFPSSEAMPALNTVRPVGSGYPKERLCIPIGSDLQAKLPQAQRDFWNEAAQWLLGHRFFNALIQKFEPFLQQRFQNLEEVPFQTEALLVDDHTRYWLGPHSDSPKKVLTLLFYLPGDLSQEHLGTSIYVPKTANFKCNGGAHYSYDEFERMYTAPFRPNTLFGFVKTAESFHGVEPLAEHETCRRQLLLYDINVPAEYGLGVRKKVVAKEETAGAVNPAVKFSF